MRFSNKCGFREGRESSDQLMRQGNSLESIAADRDEDEVGLGY